MTRLAVVFLLTLLLFVGHGTVLALECPKMPEQISKEWEVEVNAAVGKIGPVKGAELTTKTNKATKDLLGRLPDAGKVYLEQMMYSSYCSSLRDNTEIRESEKGHLLLEYNRELRKAITPPPAPAPSPPSGPPKDKSVVMLVTVVDEAVVCGPNVIKPDTDLVQRSIIDVGVNNKSDTDLFLKTVRLVPQEITGGFFAGETEIGKTYSVRVDSWLDMVTVAQGYSKEGKAGSDALVRAKRARKAKGTNIWWVKPDRIDVTEIPGNKYTVKKQTVERFRLHMGLKQPGIDFIIGRIVVEIETDRGDKLKSPPLEIAVCEPGDAEGKK
jgi:hypothetical protein